jgi:hypothetical protein
MRYLHVVHLLIRENLAGGQVGFLVYPHEHWRAPDGSPYLALPAKKTADNPLIEILEGAPLDAYIDEIALKEWQLPSTAYTAEQEFEAAEWTLPSPHQRDGEFRPVPTKYRVHPVEVWVAPEHREPLRERLLGRWLTPDEALAGHWLSPTARGVFTELKRRHAHFQSDPPQPEQKRDVIAAEALCRLFGPVPDRPSMDAPG